MKKPDVDKENKNDDDKRAEQRNENQEVGNTVKEIG